MDGIRRGIVSGVSLLMSVRGYIGALGLLRSNEVIRVLVRAPVEGFDLIEIQGVEDWDFWVEESEDPGGLLGVLAFETDGLPSEGWLEVLVPEEGTYESPESCSRPTEALVFRALYLGVPAVELLGEWYAW